MDGGMSIWHWIILSPIFLGFLALFGVPIAQILRRAGHSPWWTIVWFIPMVNLAALWIFAFSPWPALRGDAKTETTRP